VKFASKKSGPLAASHIEIERFVTTHKIKIVAPTTVKLSFRFYQTIKMAPFSSLLDFVTHKNHHHAGSVRVVVNSSSLSLDTSSSFSHSTFSVEPMNKPLSEQLEAKDDESQRVNQRVSFYHSVRVQFVEGVDGYSFDEKRATWYCKQEFESMKRDRRATVKVMEDGNPNVDNDQHYFRGVENKTRRGSQAKQWNMVEAAMAVFDEQQVFYHGNASQAIADAYSAAVAHTSAEAAKRGLHDQRAALESWKDPATLSCESFSAQNQMPRRLSCRAA
jgi:hypothetical protein